MATQGRSFWILDELNVLHQISDEINSKPYHLYLPETTYLFGGPSFSEPGGTLGKNPEPGVVVHYNLQEAVDSEVKLEFYEDDGDLIRSFSSEETLEGEPVEESEQFYEEEGITQSDVVPMQEWLNSFTWNMRYPGATDLEGQQILWAGSTIGPQAIPGTYSVRLVVDDETIMDQEFEITKDPRIETTQDDFEAQFELHQTIIAKLDTTHKTINRIREVRGEINDLLEENPGEDATKLANTIKEQLDEIENALVQTKAEAYQDVLNYPIKLNNKLAALASTVATGDNRPTEQQYAVYKELAKKVDAQFERLEPILSGEFPELRQEIENPAVPIEQ